MKQLMLQNQYSQMDYLRLIGNADRAYQRCVESDSEWGQNYWMAVIHALLRQAKQTVH